MVEVAVEIANPRLPERRVQVTLLADTAATYSMIPRPFLEQIGVVPTERLEFEIADGRRIEREVGQANFLWDGRERTSVVIFGSSSDAAVLGVVALESLGLEVDPTNKQLRPAKLILY